MNYRHEWKHEINFSDMVAIRQSLRAIASPDPHAQDGKYEVRSLYFDNLYDKALREKIDGVNKREKFRIRFYAQGTPFVRLEKKSKINGLCAKEEALLTEEETQKILADDIDWMADCDRPLLREFYSKMRAQGLRGKTIVAYTREPFVYAPGNVRVTFDYNIRTGLGRTDLLNPDCPLIPVGDTPIILEVKWDGFLPDIIRDAVQVKGRHASAFSKYAACRIYG